ncbi:SipW-dependent-type signal peptide-containing protein [Microbacterium sp. NIBRBAC000506063]|nr:SipW-dependent-type signal peptide-containing protein [Microbacterium sp. NIBRBAC000506063]QTV79202.1 SipW-dependent-type signal peptide-containing protein [Microbacterium sp. NIBRBAC000506063]
MNRFAKGAVAAGAGLVLLLGGAGSLAHWNAQDALDGGPSPLER